ncbi:hypothetical protein GCM10023226_16270 [Nocardioides nanhaiensis]|uniref:Glycosyl hydrolase family 32 N-terminal domain-containing protein n=1 Tax=Nocardioides nanhaiensis TaxID=1476871 RepID=A0ABP8W2S5_9ACTN
MGHAISTDLCTWEHLPDALPQALPETLDDLATWTGSVVRDDGGTWWMFTSGIAHAEQGRVQRIGAATSPDLITWERRPLRLEADPRWYLADEAEPVDWRDPFVVRDDVGLWHMYVTARVPRSQVSGGRGHGVVAHATSRDLEHWEVGPPLGGPAGRFDQLEVVNLGCVEGRWVLLFSCLSPEMPDAAPGASGVWSVPVAGVGSPVDARRAVRLTSEDLYVGRLVQHEGAWQLLAFENRGPDGVFTGGVVDPLPVRWRADGAGLELRGGPARYRPA